MSSAQLLSVVLEPEKGLRLFVKVFASLCLPVQDSAGFAYVSECSLPLLPYRWFILLWHPTVQLATN